MGPQPKKTDGSGRTGGRVPTSAPRWRWGLLLLGLGCLVLWEGGAPSPSPLLPFPRVLLVCPEGCPYKGLQEAVEAAAPGDVIRLWAGRHRGIALLNKPLTVEGEGQQETIWEGWIGVIDARDVTLQDLRIQSGSVRIRRSRAIRLEGVEVVKSPIDGIRVEESEDVALERVVVRGSRGSGLVVQDSPGVGVSESAFEHNGEDGVRVEGESRVELRDNLLGENQGCALRAEDPARLAGEGNRDVGNGDRGGGCRAARSPTAGRVQLELEGASPGGGGGQAYLGVAGQPIRVRLGARWELEGGLLLRVEPLRVDVAFLLSPDSAIDSGDRELGRASWELRAASSRFERELLLPADLFQGERFVFWRPVYLGAVATAGEGVRVAVRSGFVLRAAARAEFAHGATAVAFSPDGRSAAAGGCARRTEARGCVAGEIRWISPVALPPIRAWEAHAGYVRSLAFSPDGELLASASPEDDAVIVWEVATGRRVFTLPHPDGGVGIGAVAFHPSGQLLAAGAEDGSVLLWDRFTGRLIGRWRAHPEAVFSLAFDLEGRWLATGSRDASVKVWEALSGRLVKALRGRLGWILSVAFSPDGRWIALGSRDGTVRLWEWQAAARDADSAPDETSSFVPGVRALRGHEGWVRSVAFHPGGRWLLSAADDGTVIQWRLTGEAVRVLRGHLDRVEALAFSPDGGLLVSASRDGTLRFWSGF